MQDCRSKEFWVDVTGGRVFVRRWTPQILADEIPIILLHDSLGCVRMWREFPEQLAIRLGKQVLAYDRLGFGESSPRQSLPSLRFIEEEAFTVFPELCQALGVKEVIPFGHSVGGGMAIAIAGHHSQVGLCAAVITESAQAFVEHRTTEGIRDAKKIISDPAQLSKLNRYHGSKAQWVVDAWTETWLAPEFADWSLSSYLEKVRCPVLAIHGDQDEYGSCEFPRRIAGGVETYSEAVILKGFGHVPHRENPERVLDVVSGFLTRVAAPCSTSADA
jgi:pimeloyl-ACP methyl ester carboxylesterase